HAVQEGHHSKRRGGGRPRKPGTSRGAESTLREMKGRCERLTEYHDQAWQMVTEAEWGQLGQEYLTADPKKLEALLDETEGAAARAAQRCAEIRNKMGQLKSQMKES